MVYLSNYALKGLVELEINKWVSYTLTYESLVMN